MESNQDANAVTDLSKIYQKFRLVGIELEEFIDRNTPMLSPDMTENDIHRLDKCSVVLKMAFKDIKRICRLHGLTQLKTEAKENFKVELVEVRDGEQTK